MEISDVRANDHHIYIFRCWLCWGVIDPIGSVFNLDMFSLFFVNKELLLNLNFNCEREQKEVYPEDLPYYYPIAVTEVDELSGMPDDPCDENPDYNDQECIKEYKIRTAGCKTKWDTNNYPLCTRFEDFV